MMELFCPNCNVERWCNVEDMGVGYTEYGSHGRTDTDLWWVCSICDMPVKRKED